MKQDQTSFGQVEVCDLLYNGQLSLLEVSKIEDQQNGNVQAMRRLKESQPLQPIKECYISESILNEKDNTFAELQDFITTFQNMGIIKKIKDDLPHQEQEQKQTQNKIQKLKLQQKTLQNENFHKKKNTATKAKYIYPQQHMQIPNQSLKAAELDALQLVQHNGKLQQKPLQNENFNKKKNTATNGKFVSPQQYLQIPHQSLKTVQLDRIQLGQFNVQVRQQKQ